VSTVMTKNVGRNSKGAGPAGTRGPLVPKRSRRAVTQDELEFLVSLPAPNKPTDRIVLEIRKFIASSIFFNAQAAEKAGLGLTDLQMLHMLQLYGPATPGRLAAGTGLSSGGVTVALDRLEKGGYIRREPNPADRRSLLIDLIPGRLIKFAAIYESVEAETRRQLATLSARDLEAVIRFFAALSSIRPQQS
jgi:MarR family transcriptional regulator, organic hydroperoxide resistance regulator